MSETPVTLLRDMAARNAAIRRYAAAQDKFDRWEQRLRQNLGDASPEDIEDVHEWAMVALRAMRNELDDPEPKKW